MYFYFQNVGAQISFKVNYSTTTYSECVWWFLTDYYEQAKYWIEYYRQNLVD